MTHQPPHDFQVMLRSISVGEVLRTSQLDIPVQMECRLPSVLHHLERRPRDERHLCARRRKRPRA